MKPTTALFVIAALIVTIFLSAKPKKEVAAAEKRTTVVSVCNSAVNCKKILDVYFKLGYTLDQPITTQIIAVHPIGSLYTDFNQNGATYEREYIIILSK